MMGFGFWEVALIALIALLVLGPERLPGAARTVGAYLRKARSTWTGLRHEIERELAADELRRVVNAAQQQGDKETSRSGQADIKPQKTEPDEPRTP